MTDLPDTVPRLHAVATHLGPCDPAALLSMNEAARGPRLFWSAPGGRRAVAAFGVAQAARASGPDRLRRAAEQVARWHACLQVQGRAARPWWVGGFAFEPTVDDAGPWRGFEAAWFVLPRVSVAVTGATRTLTLVGAKAPYQWARAAPIVADRVASMRAPDVFLAERAAGGPPTHWGELLEAAFRDRVRRRVERALVAIATGAIEKVVVAATQTERFRGPVDPLAVLQTLRGACPDCYAFLVSPAPGLAFVGATPELLVRVAGDRLWTTALAGSAARDPDPAADAARGRALLGSAKDLREHRMVVDEVSAELRGAGYRVKAPRQPALLRLLSVQHLETPISARMTAPGDVLLEAERLHPTPALGGRPRQPALELISELEGRPRGWYGGGVGLLEGQGAGELAVAIRSVLVAGHTVTAYAGAGIVAGSDPDAEADEILMKLDATLGVLHGR